MMNRFPALFIMFCVVSASFTAIPIADELTHSNSILTHAFGTRAATTRYVGGTGPGNYSTIQGAINAASAGDTIRIYDGRYFENIYLNKTLTIIGNGSAKSIINGTGARDVITVNAHWCNVTKLSVWGAQMNTLFAGIRLNSNYNRITWCNCSRNALGMYLNSSSNNEISNNTIAWNYGVTSEADDDALARWKCDEASWSGTIGEVKDSSGNGFHGVAQNGATTTTGKWNRAGSFDGVNDCVDLGTHTEYNVTSKLTLSGWIYVKGTTSWPAILTKQGSFHLTSYSGSGAWRMGVYISGSERMVDSTTSISTNKWYLITGTFDGSYVKVYVNGVFDKQASASGSVDKSSKHVYMGPLWGMPSSYGYNGLIDDARIYNRVLSNTEIYNLYASNALSNNSNQAAGGVLITGSDNNTIKDNNLSSNDGHGIHISASENNLLDNNTVRDNYGAGISVKEAFLNTVSNNTVTLNHGLEPVAEGLIGSWQMNNASWQGATNEVLDTSGLGHHGTAHGNAKESALGRFGRAAEFDGSGDYVEANAPVIEDNSVTYGGWIKWRTIAADGSGYDMPMGQADPTDVGFELYTDASNSNIYAWDGSNQAGGFKVDKNVWYHIYAVHDGTKFALFVNGTRVGNWVASTASPVSQNFVIGGGAQQSSYWFDGWIDDVRVYNRTLTNDELNTTYRTGAHGGIYVLRSVNITVRENTCQLNEGAGIGLFDSSNNFIENNTLAQNRRSGLALNSSFDNWVSNNTATANTGSGIYLENLAQNNNITYNIIKGNLPYGAHVNKSGGNRLHHNAFLNDLPTLVQACDDGSGNEWDWGQIGNYWSDHQTPDANSPYGITDTAYSLKGNAGAKDDFPVCSAIVPPANATPYEDVLYDDNCSVVNAINPGKYTFNTNAAWLTCKTDGSLSGTPDNSQVGPYWVNGSVTGKYSTFFRNFTVTVKNTNDAPSITATDLTAATEDVLYTNTYSATDIDPPGDTLTWSLKTPAAWLSINSASGVLFGTPANSNVGSTWVNVTVGDGQGGFDHSNFTIIVANVNDAPVISTLDRLTALEDSFYSNDYNATDIDPTSDTLTWSLTTNATWPSINPATGVLSGVPGDNAAGRTFWTNVTVNDGKGGLDWSNFTIAVTNVNDAPSIVTANLVDAYEDQLYFNNYVAADPDIGDTIFTWNLKTNTDWLKIDHSTGNLSGTPNQNDVGVFWANVTVTDPNSAVGYSYFTLTVHNTNDAPVWKRLPTTGNIYRNAAYTFDADATDLDVGAQLTYGISSSPASDVSINSTSGVISWTPDAAGTFLMNLSCTDTFVTIYHTYTLNVISNNHRPTALLSTPANNSEVDVLNPAFTWTTADSDGDEVTCDLYFGKTLPDVLSRAPSALIGEDIANGSFKADNLDKGVAYFWTVVPYDGEDSGYCTSGYFMFTVAESASVNHLPKFISSPRLEAGVDVEWTYEPAAADEDNDSILFSLKEGPDGMYFSGGTLHWVPTFDQLGGNDVEIEASDGKESALQSFTVTVTEEAPDNAPPQVGQVNDVTFEEGQTASVQLDVFDPDGDSVTYEITDGPDDAKVSDTGLFTWKTADGDAGTYKIEITVSDGESSVPVIFNITINEKTVVGGDDDEPSFLASYWWIFLILLVLLILVVVIVVILIMVKRKRKDEEKTPEAAPPQPAPPLHPEVVAPAYAQPMEAPQPDIPPPAGGSIYGNMMQEPQAAGAAYPPAQAAPQEVYQSPQQGYMAPPAYAGLLPPAPFESQPPQEAPAPSMPADQYPSLDSGALPEPAPPAAAPAAATSDIDSLFGSLEPTPAAVPTPAPEVPPAMPESIQTACHACGELMLVTITQHPTIIKCWKCGAEGMIE